MLNKQNGSHTVAVTNEEDPAGYTAQVLSPIIADGEAIGRGAAAEPGAGATHGDTEMKVAETAAGIVGRQMEQ